MSKQQVNDSLTTRKVVIFSGGTVVHVRPHFSLCAPAYGKVGDTLEGTLKTLASLARCFGSGFTVEHIKTKMAGGDEVETNEDLAKKLDEVLNDPKVSAIIMAAAICDYQPNGIYLGSGEADESGSGHGKDKRRLDSRFHRRLQLKPADKIIDKIKQERPDVFLATFKTTSDETEEHLQYKATQNLERSGADIVLGNDIKNKYNILVTHDSCKRFDARSNCLHDLAVAVSLSTQ